MCLGESAWQTHNSSLLPNTRMWHISFAHIPIDEKSNHMMLTYPREYGLVCPEKGKRGASASHSLCSICLISLNIVLRHFPQIIKYPSKLWFLIATVPHQIYIPFFTYLSIPGSFVYNDIHCPKVISWNQLILGIGHLLWWHLFKNVRMLMLKMQRKNFSLP